MRDKSLSDKGAEFEDPREYLLDMLLSLGRVARSTGEPFLAYLIEMAALEAARLKKEASGDVDSDERH
jgi:hypothetical protein